MNILVRKVQSFAAQEELPGKGADVTVEDFANRPLRIRLPAHEHRTEAQVREHYALERQLADRLRRATRTERQTLYSSLYDELFRRVPEHPMLSEKASGRDIAPELKFIGRFLKPETVFMEIGSGDCALSCRVATRVKHVYAVDVSEEIVKSVHLDDNIQLCLSDGTSIPVPEGSVDVAYSNQLMEHLHPDDAVDQLRNIYRALAPGGVYLCVTPNRLYGPSDVSGYFDEVSTGFHLREYSGRELRKLFKQAGFYETRFYVTARRHYFRWPTLCAVALEFALEALPYAMRKRITRMDRWSFRAAGLLGVRVAGIKPS